jgi:hypothetical protein
LGRRGGLFPRSDPGSRRGKAPQSRRSGPSLTVDFSVTPHGAPVRPRSRRGPMRTHGASGRRPSVIPDRAAEAGAVRERPDAWVDVVGPTEAGPSDDDWASRSWRERIDRGRPGCHDRTVGMRRLVPPRRGQVPHADVPSHVDGRSRLDGSGRHARARGDRHVPAPGGVNHPRSPEGEVGRRDPVDATHDGSPEGEPAVHGRRWIPVPHRGGDRSATGGRAREGKVSAKGSVRAQSPEVDDHPRVLVRVIRSNNPIRGRGDAGPKPSASRSRAGRALVRNAASRGEHRDARCGISRFTRSL